MGTCCTRNEDNKAIDVPSAEIEGLNTDNKINDIDINGSVLLSHTITGGDVSYNVKYKSSNKDNALTNSNRKPLIGNNDCKSKGVNCDNNGLSNIVTIKKK